MRVGDLPVVARERLVLYPADPFWREPEAGVLQRVATELGLTGPEADNAAHFPGTSFMRLLVFLGCAPVTDDAAVGAETNRYRIVFRQGDAAPVMHAGNTLVAPACPACGQQDHSLKAIQLLLETTDDVYWVCPACQARVSMQDVDWQRKAAVAATAIEIHGVHEGEAVPDDRLLHALQNCSGVAWEYCYCRDR